MRESDADSDMHEEMRFHERKWAAERFGWVLMLGFMIVALLGGFGGGGPFSHATIGDAAVATLTYERFARSGRPTALRIRIADPPPRAVLELGAAYLRDFEITSVRPVPLATELSGGRYRMTFAVNDSPVEIVLRLSPEAFGSRRGVLFVMESQLAFDQFIYP